MIDSKYRISLDVNSTTSNVRLKCKRGDTGRTIYAALTESGYPYHITDDCYAVFTATKPDGKKVYNGCEIEGCMIVYELTPQTVAVPGLVKCEIKLYGADDKLITSASFLLEVCNAQVNDGDELESETEVEALTQLISQAIGMNAKLEKLPNFGSGAKVGDYLMVAEVDKEKRMVTVIPTDAPADLSGYAKIEQLPKNTSDLNNDSGFVTRLVADLANYYAKSETYNRKEIDQKIGTIPKFSIKVVQSLPAQDINETTVYLLAEGNETGDLYSEWIYANGKWELLGSQRGDLTGYAKETWVDQKLTDYALVTAVPKKVSQLQNDVGYLTEHQDISGKLDANKLPEAVETALAKAKESGVFDGKDGHSPSIMVAKNEITGDVVISVEKNGVYQSVVIPKCTDGEPGEDGFSPNATVEQAENGAVITITDKNGTTTATVANGKDGTDGQDGSPGKDGSDGVSVTHEWNGTVLKVTSAAGTSSADLKGEPGKDGGKGADGKTAYQYAQDGGYTGTETEFSTKLSETAVSVTPQTLTDEQKAQARQNIGVTGNKWAGKVASFLGDSITRGMNTEKTYHAYLQELVGFFACNGYGISGSTIANYYEAMCNRVSQIDTQSDIVFVFGGTNDFNVGIPMGEWYTLNGTTRTVNKDISTFRGALATLCEALLSRFPNKKTVLLTPLHRHTYPDDYTEMQANAKGLYLEDYVNAIKEAGKIYSIPVIDLYAESGLYPRSNASAAIYFHSNDKLHPNSAGHRVIADVIRGFLDRTYPMYQPTDVPEPKPEPVYYPVELNLENCTINNSVTTVASGSAYSATVDTSSGYDLKSLTVTMDGTDITSSAVNGKYIYIATVTGAVVITAVAVLVYTNLVPSAEERIISGDALTGYDGVGYANNYRLSSSGVIKSAPMAIATGFIPVSAGNTIRIGGIQWCNTGSAFNYVCAYKSDYSFIGAVYGSEAGYYGTKIHASCTIDYDTPLTTIVLTNNADIAFIRLSCYNEAQQDGSKLIVTVNEEIV